MTTGPFGTAGQSTRVEPIGDTGADLAVDYSVVIPVFNEEETLQKLWMRSVVEMLEAVAGEKHVVLETQLDPAYVVGDPARLGSRGGERRRVRPFLGPRCSSPLHHEDRKRTKAVRAQGLRLMAQASLNVAYRQAAGYYLASLYSNR